MIRRVSPAPGSPGRTRCSASWRWRSRPTQETIPGNRSVGDGEGAVRVEPGGLRPCRVLFDGLGTLLLEFLARGELDHVPVDRDPGPVLRGTVHVGVLRFDELVTGDGQFDGQVLDRKRHV